MPPAHGLLRPAPSAPPSSLDARVGDLEKRLTEARSRFDPAAELSILAELAQVLDAAVSPAWVRMHLKTLAERTATEADRLRAAGSTEDAAALVKRTLAVQWTSPTLGPDAGQPVALLAPETQLEDRWLRSFQLAVGQTPDETARQALASLSAVSKPTP